MQKRRGLLGQDGHVAAALLVGGLATPAVAAASPSAAPVVVVSGLNNPRQLSFDPNGRLLVAEAGRGGSHCIGSGNNQTCIGTTGSISRIAEPGRTAGSRPDRIVRGLLSAGGPDGTFTVGSDGVAGFGGQIYVAMTYAPPDVVPHPLPGKQLGKLLVARPGGQATIAGDVTGVEFRCPNCDGYRDPKTHRPELDSNPYAALVLPDGTVLVADAAGNDILAVRNGHARVFAVLPQHGSGSTDRQATPTSLAFGPHGTILVGELAHEEQGAARVDVLSRGGGYLGFIGRGGSILNVRGGLSTITGVAYGNGSYYVSQLEAGDPNLPGLLTRIGASGHTTSVAVPFPAGVAVGREGNVYVAAWSIAPASGAFGVPHSSGQVWRLRL